MEVLVNATHVVLPVLYTVLVLAYGRIFGRGPSGIAIFSKPILVGVVVAHGGSILLMSAMLRACPLGSAAEFLSLMAFAIAVIYLVIELRSGDRTLGIFAITPAFVLQIIATIGILSRDGTPASNLGLEASIHVFAAVIGFASVALASIFGVLYLFLYAAIKHGRFGLFFKKMPSLEALSRLNLEGVSIAFLALSVNVVVGLWGYFRHDGATVTLTDPTVIMTLVVWMVFGACAMARRWLDLGGRRLAFATLIGVPYILAVFLGELFVRGGFHG